MAGGGGSVAAPMSLWTGVAYIVGITIGSGIYSSPGYIMGSVGSGGAALLVWGLGGLVGYIGAMAYVELGMRYKDRPGGDITYLAEQYGDLMGFVCAMSQMFILRPASIGMICVVFGDNINAALGLTALPSEQAPEEGGGNATAPESSDATPIHPLLLKAPAVLGLVTLCILNVASASTAAAVQRYITGGKVLCLGALAACAVPVLINPGMVERDTPPDFGFANTSTSLGDWGEGFMNSLWAYDGWANVAYLTTELATPHEVKKCIVIGLPLCIALYLVANIAYLIVLDADVVAGTSHVAVSYFNALLRDRRVGGFVASVVVAMSTFGSANGTIYSAGAMTSGAAKTGLCSAGLRSYTYAVVFECLIALVFMLFVDFSSLLVSFGVTRYFFCSLVIAGVFILRRREHSELSGDHDANDDDHAEGGATGYTSNPLTPAGGAACASDAGDGGDAAMYRVAAPYPVIFCVFSSVLIIAPVAKRPYATLFSFVGLLASIPLYYVIPVLQRRFGGRDGCWGALLPLDAASLDAEGASPSGGAFEELTGDVGGGGGDGDDDDDNMWSDENGDPNQC